MCSTIAVLVLVCLNGLMLPVRADEITSATAPQVAQEAASQDEDKWEFKAPLYLWAMALTGTVTLKGNNATVDQSFTDLFDHMDQGFMAYLILAKPQYGFYVNPNYFSLSFGGHDSSGNKVTLDTQMWAIEMAGFYRIWEYEGDRPASLYAVGGARYWNLHNNIKVKGDGADAGTKWLLDPMIGLRFKERITQHVHVMGQSDIGGFNLAGQTSRFSYQLMGLIGYDFTMPVIKKESTVFGGWRQINIQKTSGSGTVNQDAFNLNFSGVVLGLNVELF